MSRDIVLMTRELSLAFGGNQVLSGFDIDVDRGCLFAIIGPNGAGKTSLFNVLTRLYQPQSGRLVFDDIDLLARPPAALAGLGIVRTFQDLLVLPGMSVLENVMLGLHTRFRHGNISAVLRLPAARREEHAMRERGFAALEMVGLARQAALPAEILPFGHKRLLELARCIVSEPKLILLDEPSAGMSSQEVEDLKRTIGTIRRQSTTTILLIAHTMNLVLRLSDRVAVLDHGVKIAEGPPAAVMRHPDVVKAYLGAAGGHAPA